MLTASALASPRPLPGWRLALNLIGYQAGWFAAVYSATHNLPWLGPLLVALLIALHLSLSERPLGSVALIAGAFLLGFALETAMWRLGFVAYPTYRGGVPMWMLALWPLFATTLSVSLRWFQTRLLLAALAGAVAGPLAYWGGAAVGAIALPDLVHSLAGIGVAWMVAFPLLLVAASRLEHAGVGEPVGGEAE